MSRKAIAFLVLALTVAIPAGAVVGILRGISSPPHALIDQISRTLVDQLGRSLVD